jgi:hypothetical protein
MTLLPNVHLGQGNSGNSVTGFRYTDYHPAQYLADTGEGREVEHGSPPTAGWVGSHS